MKGAAKAPAGRGIVHVLVPCTPSRSLFYSRVPICLFAQIFTPRFCFQSITFLLVKRRNESLGELTVRDERDVHVYRFSADDKAVGRFAREYMSGDVDDKVE